MARKIKRKNERRWEEIKKKKEKRKRMKEKEKENKKKRDNEMMINCLVKRERITNKTQL